MTDSKTIHFVLRGATLTRHGGGLAAVYHRFRSRYAALQALLAMVAGHQRQGDTLIVRVIAVRR